ncbi:hypothetical protein ACEZDB_37330 [Streptacidiphilus sp. N1-3]|uniref:Uncharacterized protein n=1 Tax=Streptacidiphilus alkalitolerans TaxID=3342712 RepID=A0ABV6XDK1_9ACTN
MTPRHTLAAYAALLDRSVEQIAEAAADARTFDRLLIARVADVWDNNTYPFFRAATAHIAWRRERRARAALRWMAALSSTRQAWMEEQAAVAGHRIGALLGEPAPDSGPSRDYAGVVRPDSGVLDAALAEAWTRDYALDRARVRTLRLERVGSALTGFVLLEAERRFPVAGQEARAAASPAELQISLDEVSEVCFDSDDPTGAVLTVEADGRVGISLGRQGVLRGSRSRAYVHDWAWHLSTAGRAADAVVPALVRRGGRRSPGDPPGGLGPFGAAALAARLLHFAMLEIRSVRFAAEAHRISLQALCRALSGCGTAVARAGAVRSVTGRERAFCALVEAWIRRGGAELEPWFAERLREVAEGTPLPRHTTAWVRDLQFQHPAAPATDRAVRVSAAKAARAAPVEASVELRLVSHTASHTTYSYDHQSSALVQFARPPGADAPGPSGWLLHARALEPVTRFQVRTEAFAGPGLLQLTTVDGGGAAVITLDGDALTVTGTVPTPR